MNRTLVFGLATVLLGGLLWVLSDGSRTQGEADGAERAHVTGPGPDTNRAAPIVEAGVTNVRNAVQLVPPPRAPAATSDAAGPDDAAPPTGTLRILGLVRVGEDPLPSDDANVRMSIRAPERALSRSLGMVPVHAGRFTVVVAADDLSFMEGRGSPRGYLTCDLAAPGFEIASAEMDISKAVDGVLHVALDTEKCGPLVVGRVVDAAGAAVALADVVVVDYGPLGQDVESHELQSGADGYFQVALPRRGFVDAVASHSSHGVVKVAARSESELALLDLGDLRLAPLGVVAGRIVGYGRAPLGRHSVELQPISEGENFRSHRMLTDDEGRFRFACLDATGYRVKIAGDDRPEAEQPIVTPDALDLELFVSLPSARVTVVGAPESNVELTVLPLQRAADTWRVSGPREWHAREAETLPGVFHVPFSRPGTYSVRASTTVDGGYWTAHERVEIGREHRVLRLDLSPESRAKLWLTVVDPSDAPLPDWEASFIDSATGIVGGTSRMKRPEVTLAQGRWIASVEPSGETYVMPFQVEVQVTLDQERLKLRATERGGKLIVRAALSGSERSRVVATVQRVGGGPSFTMGLGDGAEVALQHPIQAGDYELRVPAARFDHRSGDPGAIAWSHDTLFTRAFTIRAGDTTRLELSVP